MGKINAKELESICELSEVASFVLWNGKNERLSFMLEIIIFSDNSGRCSMTGWCSGEEFIEVGTNRCSIGDCKRIATWFKMQTCYTLASEKKDVLKKHFEVKNNE